jgi:hypothetical protein
VKLLQKPLLTLKNVVHCDVPKGQLLVDVSCMQSRKFAASSRVSARTEEPDAAICKGRHCPHEMVTNAESSLLKTTLEGQQ